MNTFEAFISPFFDPTFNAVATPSGSTGLQLVDVAEFNQHVREAIQTTAQAAIHRNPDPSSRIFLLKGESGYGKTHTLTSTLGRMLRDQPIYPAVLQLAANINKTEISRWVLNTVICELEASYFQDQYGRTPLQNLVSRLMNYASDKCTSVFNDSIEKDDFDEDETIELSKKLAKEIARNIARANYPEPDYRFLAALILKDANASPEARTWLLGGEGKVKIGSLILPEIGNDGCNILISELAKCVHVTNGALIFALDQIESISKTSSMDHLASIITEVNGFAQKNNSIAIIYCALVDTFTEVQQYLNHSELDRIIKGPRPPRTMEPLNQQVMREIVNLRADYLLSQVGAEKDTKAGEKIAPNWLIENNKNRASTVRSFFEDIRRYRAICEKDNCFVVEERYQEQIVDVDPPDQKTETLDFDKLWADAKDADIGRVERLTDYERSKDLAWAAKAASIEIPDIANIDAETQNLPGQFSTRIVDVSFLNSDEQPVERWKIAFTDEPNQKMRLLNQINEFLDNCPEAMPAMVREKNIPGVKNGVPEKNIRRLQAGPALDNLFNSGGRALQIATEDWTRLRLVKKFCEEHSESRGFNEWRRQCKFVLKESGVNGLEKLLSPSGPIQLENEPVQLIFEEEEESEIETDSLTGSQIETNKSSNTINDKDPRNSARIWIGDDPSTNKSIYWDLDRDNEIVLPNFGISISGDAGQGKTQIILAIIAEASSLGCPIIIFDFKNDYTGKVVENHGFTVFDLRNQLPFNPLQPPPTGPAGCQPIEHVYEVAGILGDSLRLGSQQKGLLREALINAFEDKGIRMRDWQDPSEFAAPSFAEIVERIEEIGGTTASGLVNRLGYLDGLRLLPSNSEARVSFEELINGRSVLLFSNLPADDELKKVLSELILIQAHAHMLRGEQPKALRRLLVFDEAWRAASSKRLIGVAREGRAFGAGVIAGSQFSDDLSEDLTGNLATKIYFYNSDANRRKNIVVATFGTTTSKEAKEMLHLLGQLKQFEIVFCNQHYVPYKKIRSTPFFER